LITEFKEILSPSQLSPLAMTHRWDAYSLKLIKILILVWTRTWDPCYGNSTNIWDPTMYFITLISIKADHSWAQAIKVTPIIAKMTYYMQTIFLVSLHMGNMETTIVCERHHNLERWHYEGNDFTFHSLCLLQHLASKIAFSTPSFPAFIWYDNENMEFIWHSSFITVHIFYSLVQELMHSVYEQFEKITFGE